ncbi:mitochondrial import inner membrane translocase subunit Tim16 [Drosophila obscura]|uniref:mitochondrial import inner membrane translocase subunit Tim16 n=1 Tax=Drosophila obscura TaxID=7282 RepID=UPI001BB2645D|nr:mitochondrial import inner membrane translocase subunit Tim16 [Drosophila obscura]
MARYLVRIVLLGAQSVGKAFAKTVRQEIEAHREAARMHAAQSDPCTRTKSDAALNGMTLAEAQSILNVKDVLDRREVENRFQHLFQANETKTGGSFYIQSKVFRAKERIDEEIKKLEAQTKSQVQSESK